MNDETARILKDIEERFARCPDVRDCRMIASIYSTEGDSQKAKEYYEKALGMQLDIVKDKDISEYNEYLTLGDLYEKVKDKENADKVYVQVLNYLAKQTETTEVLTAKGQIYEYFIDYDEAIECYQKLLSKDTENVELLEKLMHIYGKYPGYKYIDVTKKYAQRILELEPDNCIAKLELYEKAYLDNLPQKRTLIDISDSSISQDIIEYATKIRWWDYIIFVFVLVNFAYFVYLLLMKML